MKSKSALSLVDYERMHSVIKSVSNAARLNTPHACIFFAIAGAALITVFHKRSAEHVAGAAFYKVDNATGFTMAYGRLASENDGGTVSSDEQSFHCWVESEGVIIDLMAPIFQETLQSAGRTETVPAMMFQRPLARMSRSPYALNDEGDFFLQPNHALGLRITKDFLARPGHVNLLQICTHLYRPHPEKMRSSIKVGVDNESVIDIQLSHASVVGEWESKDKTMSKSVAPQLQDSYDAS